MDSGYSSPCQINLSGYAEAFIPVQSDSQTSEWYSYFENDVLVFPLERIKKHLSELFFQTTVAACLMFPIEIFL